MLEEHRKIDAVAITQDGFVELVIMDAGITEDPEQRFSHLIEKLKVYVYYVIEGDFKKEHPEKSQKDVRFLVMCRVPPTEKMAKLTRLSHPQNPDEGFDIFYRHFPSADEPEEPSSVVVPSVNSQKRNLGLYVTYGLAALIVTAAMIGWVNAGRSPVPGIVIAIVLTGYGFLVSKAKRT